MNKPLRRVISAILALSLSVTLAVNAYAEEIEKVHKQAAVSAEAVATKEKSEKAKKPEKTPITKDNLPEVLDFDRVKGQGFVSRLKSEEKSLSEVVLEKEDGTRMLYLFEEDIKFHDNEGNIKDKSNKAVRKNNVFVGESNNIETVLPTSIMGGVSVSDESIEITMKPVSKLGITRFNSVGTINGENSVIYEDVFDSFTNLEYTFTYSGVKEDIILEKYTGNNTFSFEVTTGGLSLTEDKGTLVMKDENGEAKAVMSEIVVFSADNKNNTFGEYTIKEKIKNSLYIVEISVDKAYLADPNTVYPVTIDPTTISLQNGGTIEDMQVFKGTDGTGNTETSAGASGVSRVGWTDWGACRTLMKFKGSVNSAFNNITDSWQITNAYVEMRDLMCQSTSTTIKCCQFAGSNWDDAEQRTWNDLKATTISTSGGSVDVFYGNGNPSDDRTLSDGEHWYNWNITNIVKGWVGNSSYRNKGIIFYVKNPSYEYSSNYANYMKTFCSIEGTASYRPYFCIEYKTNGCKGVQTLSSSQYQQYNCLRYAFWRGPASLLNISDSFSTEEYFCIEDYIYCSSTTVGNALARTKLRMNSWLNDTFGSTNWRDVTSEGYTVDLKSDEWLVCMRIGVNDGLYDYHFWYRANDGNWYNKHGWANESEEMIASGVVNPSTANSSSGWALGEYQGFYSSNTIYYAISA